MPVGSELSRRAMRLPVGPQAPQKIQQPHAVCRRCAVRRSLRAARPPCARSWSGPSGSAGPSSALPEYSLRQLLGRRARRDSRSGQESFTIGSGYAPPSVSYSARIRVKSPRHDLQIRARLAGRLRALPVPLQPARGVGQRAVLLGEAGGGQAEHVGLDLAPDRRRCARRSCARTRRSPWRAGPSSTRNFSFARARFSFALFGAASQRIEALADEAVHLALAMSSKVCSMS